MALESELRALAGEIAWPTTPTLRAELEPRRRGLRRPLLAAVALAVTAVAVALAVPQSRATILRFFRLGAATVQFVQRLPAAQERPLAAELGPAVPTATARTITHGTLLLPPFSPAPPLHAKEGVISVLFRYHGAPVLLSEVYETDGLLKKIAGSATRIVSVSVGGNPGLWLSGAPHVYYFPGAPPRLAHNVLVWQADHLTLRLEGRHLTKAAAETLAQALR